MVTFRPSLRRDAKSGAARAASPRRATLRKQQRADGARIAAAAIRKSVVFDVEGTLIDCVFQTTESWQRTLQDFGYSFSSLELHRYSGMDPDDMLRVLVPDASSDEREHIKTKQGDHYRRVFLPSVDAFPGVRSLLEKLRRSGRRIALATTCQNDELAAYLELTGIGEFVDAVACGDDGVRGKPHPDLFRLALGRLGARTDAIAVGDTPYDAIAASRAGVRTIGTTSGGCSYRELEDAGCFAVIGRLPQLLEFA